MKYESEQIECSAALAAAQLMCAAARTAPKTRGIDKIETLILTGEDLSALADKMEEIDERSNGTNRTHFTRDAGNLRASQAVVLIGVRKFCYGLNCAYCGFAGCEECETAGGTCVFSSVDLGIAVGSAVSKAADLRVDTRVMYSIGNAAAEMNYAEKDIIWLGIPLSIKGKSPFFDRK
ncbi:MAG: DUF2148 domain-containing protein [Eubacteriales bacterium]|nr:DUF2148 domain-containing protein [Eubacteriales bacterium]